MLISVAPVLIMLTWVGNLYYQQLLEKHLLEEDFIGELAVEHIQKEVVRLHTLLINKSDPIAYTLKRDKNLPFIDELIHQVIKREASVHALLLLDKQGEIVTGIESYQDLSLPVKERAGLLAHWRYLVDEFPDEIKTPFTGETYIGPVSHHPEGMFFTISIPVGNPEAPLAVLLAKVDATILWKGLQEHLQEDDVVNYLVDSNGRLLSSTIDSGFSVGESVSHLPVIQALKKHAGWHHKQTYVGLMGEQVFGSLSEEKQIGLGVITEIDRDDILQPIYVLMIKMVLVAAIVVGLSLWLGVQMLRLIINPIGSISDEFKRVAKQDFRHSLIHSSFQELQSLVNGFNLMVDEIKHSHNQLKQASVVFDNTSEGILITDADHEIISVNRAFCEITGYAESEVLGKNPSLLRSGYHDKAFYQSLWQSIKETGKWRGEIRNKRKNGEVYTELLSINTFRDAQGKLTYHIGVFTDISNIKETESKLDYLAHHDQLTGLPNRLLCQARLEHELQLAKRHSEQVGILFLDLDMFKTVNDSMGHAKGDILLQQVANCIKQSIRSEDTVARLGGDEFVIIIGSLKNRHDAARVAENTLSLFSRPFNVAGQEIFIGASCGISVYPDDGLDQDVLLRNADSAMYQAKARGRNTYQFYTQALTEEASQRLTLETNLRQALDKGELSVFYQPQYSLKNETLIGVEALLRWNHSDLGLVSPGQFIPIAEETGLIVPIGEWVLKTACKQLKSWNEMGFNSVRVAVNLSSRQFASKGLEKLIASALTEADINPEDLDLELTESIIMHDEKHIVETLFKLHDMGVCLSVDDFGTGYSSLSYIQRFPLDTLKIDRSFVRDITSNSKDAEMIDSIIALGHSMNLKVLAEGVETIEQLQYLQSRGCDEAQGFYYSKAVTADEITAILTKTRSQTELEISS